MVLSWHIYLLLGALVTHLHRPLVLSLSTAAFPRGPVRNTRCRFGSNTLTTSRRPRHRSTGHLLAISEKQESDDTIIQGGDNGPVEVSSSNWLYDVWDQVAMCGMRLVHSEYLDILWEMFRKVLVYWTIPGVVWLIAIHEWYPVSAQTYCRGQSWAWVATSLNAPTSSSLTLLMQRWHWFRGARQWFQEGILRTIMDGILFQWTLKVLFQGVAFLRSRLVGNVDSEVDNRRTHVDGPPLWIVPVSILYGLTHTTVDNSVLCNGINALLGGLEVYDIDLSCLVGLASFGFSASLYYEVFGPIFVKEGLLATMGAQVLWQLFARISWRSHVMARLFVRLAQSNKTIPR